VDKFSTFLMNDVLPAISDVGGVVSGTLGPALGFAVDLFKDLFDTGTAVVRFISDLPGPLKAAAVALGAVAILKGPLADIFGGIFGRGGLIDGAAIRAMMLKDSLSSIGGAAGVAKAGASGLIGFFGGPGDSR
jgi:hypothetical protein